MEPSPSSAAPPASARDAQRLPPEPHLLRFGLRQLLAWGALLALLCGSLKLAAGAWPLVIGALALLVGAHVLGTLVGTRLRDTSSDVQRWRAARLGQPDAPVVGSLPLESVQPWLPPVTPLAQLPAPSALPVRSLVGGWLGGATLGAAAIAGTLGGEVTWAGLAMGAVSCGILGAWLAFLASNFATIARHAWRHAHAADLPQVRPSNPTNALDRRR